MKFVDSNPVGLLEFISRNLVGHKDEVEVTPVDSAESLILELRLNSEDLGRVIGKEGRIAKAVRVLLNSISTKKVIDDSNNETIYKKYLLEIIDQ